jgi:hypothetical protein
MNRTQHHQPLLTLTGIGERVATLCVPPLTTPIACDCPPPPAAPPVVGLDEFADATYICNRLAYVDKIQNKQKRKTKKKKEFCNQKSSFFINSLRRLFTLNSSYYK